jgi:hypothetical protein
MKKKKKHPEENGVPLGSLNSKEESKKSMGQKQKQKQVTKHRAPDKWMYK